MDPASSHREALERALLPLVADAGFELVSLEALAASHTLRLLIDRVEGGGGAPAPAPQADGDAAAGAGARGAEDLGAQGGVSVEHCAHVSALVSDYLDAAPAPAGEAGVPRAFWHDGDFTLEVSSPGLDRPLCRPAHFRRFVGAQITLRAATPEGQPPHRRLTGRLAAAADRADGDITLETEAGALQLAYPRISRARLVPDLGPLAAKEPRYGR